VLSAIPYTQHPLLSNLHSLHKCTFSKPLIPPSLYAFTGHHLDHLPTITIYTTYTICCTTCTTYTSPPCYLCISSPLFHNTPFTLFHHFISVNNTIHFTYHAYFFHIICSSFSLALPYASSTFMLLLIPIVNSTCLRHLLSPVYHSDTAAI
jgi:hypothetical protein